MNKVKGKYCDFGPFVKCRQCKKRYCDCLDRYESNECIRKWEEGVPPEERDD